MKVLSLTEPYATLIKNGLKTIETRYKKFGFEDLCVVYYYLKN
jgi:ASC-1-like (ASCH) protein